jgi:hypothetical protein
VWRYVYRAIVSTSRSSTCWYRLVGEGDLVKRDTEGQIAPAALTEY